MYLLPLMSVAIFPVVFFLIFFYFVDVVVVICLLARSGEAYALRLCVKPFNNNRTRT